MKRISNKELNHENWNDEEVPEERGTFSTAPCDVIAKRKVISAKRKPVSQSGIFKSFSGFDKNLSSTLVLPNSDNREKHLNNLKMLNKTFLENIEKFVSENNCCILSPLFEDYQRHLNTIKNKYPLTNSEISTVGSSVLDVTKNISPSSSPIAPSLSGMNNFNKTMPQDITNKPLFSFSNKSQAESQNLSKIPFTFANSFFKSQDNSNEVQTKPNSLFSNTVDKVNISTNYVVSQQSDFTFSSNVSKPQESSMFGTLGVNQVSSTAFNMFGGIKTSESSSLVTPFPLFPVTNTSEGTNNDDEEYVPPKPETRDIKEADSVFDIRCKLFYQIDQAWKEKGVGNIFVKPLSEGKFQLVMRADNTLGTILLNVLVTKSMPLSVTRNNLSMVAMTDFLKGEVKPTPLLIRVKTATDADELLKVMKKQLE